MTCKHDPNCRDPFCSQDELNTPCTCGHRLGVHRDHDCTHPYCRCKGFKARGAEPCPCCACNPGTVARFASLEEESHAEARWAVFGCPNSPGTWPDRNAGTTQLLIRYFDRRLFSRSEAWLAVVDVDGGQYWRKKSHTARTWAWYAVLS